MRPTDLEKDLLAEFFRAKGIDSARLIRSFDEIEVTERSFTGAGFFTDFKRHEYLKVGEVGRKSNWGEVGGRLNGEVHVGFEFYVNDGYITMIEGFTYEWPSWPGKIQSYELFREEIHHLREAH